MTDPFARFDNDESIPLVEARDLILQKRALDQTGKHLSAEDARRWYEQDRARRDATAAG